MLLDASGKRLREEENMNYDVTLKTIPERCAATVRMTVTRYEDEGMIWSRMMEEMRHMNIVGADPACVPSHFLTVSIRKIMLRCWRGRL